MTTYSFPELGVRLTIDTLHRLRAQIRTELRDPGPYTLIVTPGQWHDVLREADRDRWYFRGAYVEGQRVDELRIMDFTIVRPTELRPRRNPMEAIDDGRVIPTRADAQPRIFDRILDQIRAADFERWLRPLDQPAPRPEPATTHRNWGS